MFRMILILAAAAALYGLVYYSSLKPSHDRRWYDYYAYTPDAVIHEDNAVVLRYVRDWKHQPSETVDKSWLENVMVRPEEVSRVWFALSAIGDSKYVAHSYLVFELEDGRALSFSIEARREEGEPYSPISGLFRKYELNYSWGLERDFVGVRLFVLDYQTELYPLQLSKEQAGAVFLAMAKATHEVAEKPRFYNTLTGNCTNLLAKAINAAIPGRLPYDISWNLPALSVGYLVEQGFIDASGQSTKEIRRGAIINDFGPELLENNETPEDFSSTLRRLYFEGNQQELTSV